MQLQGNLDEQNLLALSDELQEENMIGQEQEGGMNMQENIQVQEGELNMKGMNHG